MTRLDGTLFGPNNRCFACGPQHPSGLHLDFRVDGDAVLTEFMPADAHQGAPHVMHGGLVTTVADELAGWALIALRERFGFTGTMSSRFVRPVRIGKMVLGRATIARENRRVMHVDVRLRQEDAECFSSEMMFVILDQAGAEKVMNGPLPESWRKFFR